MGPMAFVEAMGLTSLLKAWHLGAPAKELSCWSQHQNRNEPFTADEIEQYRRALTELAPAVARDLFEEYSGPHESAH